MGTSPSIQYIARAGYSARAAVFFLVGGLALFSGITGGKSDTKSALNTLLQQPFGRIWVGLIAAGLVGFVIWRLAQSLGNANNQEHDAKGLAIRAALLGSAIAYIGLAYYAADHALGFASQDNGGGERDLAGWLMTQAFGRYVAGAVGIGFIIGGVMTIAKGMLRKYERYLDPQARDNRMIKIISVYGLSARGVLFAIVGGFFVYAAFKVAPEEAGSVGDALIWIRELPYGGVLYSLVAIGLVSFGVYNLVQARYRIVRAPEISAEIHDAAQMSSKIVGFGQ